MNPLAINHFIVTILYFQTTTSRSLTLPHDWWTRKDMVEIAGYGEDKLSTVIVSGTVVREEASNKARHQRRVLPVSGVLVEVQCHVPVNTPTEHRAASDEYGYFSIDLPSELHGIPNLENVCCVEILKPPKRGCRGLSLDSADNGVRRYSTGLVALNK